MKPAENDNDLTVTEEAMDRQASEPAVPELAAVFEEHVDHVRHSLRRLGVREADVDDLVQEVFLVIRRILPDYDPARPIWPWIFGIVYRVAVAYRRTAFREVLDDGQLAEEHVDGSPDPAAALEHKEDVGLLLEALDTLEHTRRAVFVMAEIDGIAVPAIARELGIGVNTASSRLRLAREDFRAAATRLLVKRRGPRGAMFLPLLFEVERARSGLSRDARADLWRRIDREISSELDALGKKARRVVEAAALATTSLAGAKLGLLLAAVSVTSAMLGALAHAHWAPPSVVVVARANDAGIPTLATAVPASTPEIAPSSATPPPLTKRAPPRAARSAAPTPASSTRDLGLERERTLLEMARTALTRHDPSAALSALDAHAREFSRSPLAEEREMMAIQALVAARRLSEAQTRAGAFRALFPRSVLLPIVNEAVP